MNKLGYTILGGSRAVLATLTRARYARMCAGYALPGGCKRIYHYHVRKTAGTSLNAALFEAGGEDGAVVVERLRRSFTGRTRSGPYVYVRKAPQLIRQGLYWYAFSHMPMWEIPLPPQTFTVTILRDPVQRMISHYRMVAGFGRTSRGDLEHWQKHVLEREGERLGAGFDDFLDNVPRDHLKRQLFMFSKSGDAEEALDNLGTIDAVLFTETFGDDLAALGARLGLELRPKHELKSKFPFTPEPHQLERLRDMVAEEYDVLARYRAAATGLRACG